MWDDGPEPSEPGMGYVDERLPDRFMAPLPNTYQSLFVYSSLHSPPNRVPWAVRNGDVAIIDEVRVALGSMPEPEEVSSVASDYAGRIMREIQHSTPEVVDAIRALLADERLPTTVREEFGRGLARYFTYALFAVDETNALATAVRALARDLALPGPDYYAVHSFLPRELQESAIEELVELLPDHARKVVDRMVSEGRTDIAHLVPYARFPNAGDLGAHLQSIGLVEEVSQARSLVGVLEDNGRIYEMELETDQYPNRYDLELTQIARMVPELANAVFEQVPPREVIEGDEDDDILEDDKNDPHQLPGLYRLRAYLDGRTYALVGGDDSDWHDVGFILRFLDIICDDLAQPVRFFSLGESGGSARISVAPVDALRTLIAEGLLHDVLAGR